MALGRENPAMWKKLEQASTKNKKNKSIVMGMSDRTT